MSQETNANALQLSLNKLAVKAPPFNKTDVQLWFQILESQFRNSGISTEDTKYDYVISNMTDPDAINVVREHIINKPAETPYTMIKNSLIRAFEESEDEKTQKLLNDLQIGDKKPSVFLREMRSLAGKRVDDAFLKPIFFKHLPVNVQQILDALPSAKLDDVAVAADKMVRYNVNSINAVQTQQTDDTNTALLNIVQSLAKEVAELKKMQSTVSEVKTCQDPLTELIKEVRELRIEMSDAHGRQSRSRSRSREHFRRRSFSRDPSKHPTCFYHFKFGIKARKCEEPCDFRTGNEKN